MFNTHICNEIAPPNVPSDTMESWADNDFIYDWLIKSQCKVLRESLLIRSYSLMLCGIIFSLYLLAYEWLSLSTHMMAHQECKLILLSNSKISQSIYQYGIFIEITNALERLTEPQTQYNLPSISKVSKAVSSTRLRLSSRAQQDAPIPLDILHKILMVPFL